MEPPDVAWLTAAIVLLIAGQLLVAHRSWKLQQQIEKERRTVFLFVDLDWRGDGLISCKLHNLSSIPVVVTELAVTATDAETNMSNTVQRQGNWQLIGPKPRHVMFTTSEVEELVRPFTISQARFFRVDVSITYVVRARVETEVIRAFDGSLRKDWSGRYITTGTQG